MSAGVRMIFIALVVASTDVHCGRARAGGLIERVSFTCAHDLRCCGSRLLPCACRIWRGALACENASREVEPLQTARAPLARVASIVSAELGGRREI